MSEKLTCSNDTLPDQSLLRTANDPHAAILRWADDHPLEAWAVVAAVRGAEPLAEPSAPPVSSDHWFKAKQNGVASRWPIVQSYRRWFCGGRSLSLPKNFCSISIEI